MGQYRVIPLTISSLLQCYIRAWHTLEICAVVGLGGLQREQDESH